MSSRRRAIIGITKSGSRLPSAYQEVEYLESTDITEGTYNQWIDTGVLPNQDTRVMIDYQLVNGGGRMIFGETGKDTSTKPYFAYYQSAQYFYGLNVGYRNTSYDTPLSSFDYNRHLLFFDKNNIYLDADLYHSFEYGSFSGSDNLYLFGIKHASKSTYLKSCVKIFSCKIYNDITLIRDYIPCYRKVDNKSGMYDLVNDIFYTNVNANPQLLVGNDVN